MSLKSERLKKLENELTDLEQWLKLGLVPKKDLEKHREEIEIIRKKIDEEMQRLHFLKESGETEEYVPSKRPTRPTYQEPQSMPDMSMGDEGMTDEGGFEMETESFDFETATGEESPSEAAEEEAPSAAEEEDDPFSDKNRWKRGVLEDPDSDNW